MASWPLLILLVVGSVIASWLCLAVESRRLTIDGGAAANGKGARPNADGRV